MHTNTTILPASRTAMILRAFAEQSRRKAIARPEAKVAPRSPKLEMTIEDHTLLLSLAFTTVATFAYMIITAYII